MEYLVEPTDRFQMHMSRALVTLIGTISGLKINSHSAGNTYIASTLFLEFRGAASRGPLLRMFLWEI